jgi:ATP-binding cassette subfamily B protein
VEAGEHVALVGPTGSGKTSIINLLMRFYDPVEGVVRINGHDLRSWDLRDLRSRIGLVMQDPSIFSGTIRENILLGRPDLDAERLREVIRMANCDALGDRLEDGLDSRLSAEGLSLSTGERQLLSIARAFARNPELLILDEATSSVDSDTEVRIQEALERLMRGRTCLTIAHRLSTVRNTDRIYVVRQGRIIETGSHGELIEQRGFYFKLLSYQQTARPETAEAGRSAEPRP